MSSPELAPAALPHAGGLPYGMLPPLRLWGSPLYTHFEQQSEGKTGVVALLRSILADTADYKLNIKTSHVTMSKAKISLSNTTTAKPKARALATANTLVVWPFSVKITAGEDLKVAGATPAAKDANVKKASDAAKTALKTPTSSHKKALAEGMVMAGHKLMKAATGKETERTNEFKAAFGDSGIDTNDKSFTITELAAGAPSTSAGYAQVTSALTIVGLAMIWSLA